MPFRLQTMKLDQTKNQHSSEPRFKLSVSFALFSSPLLLLVGQAPQIVLFLQKCLFVCNRGQKLLYHGRVQIREVLDQPQFIRFALPPLLLLLLFVGQATLI